MFYQKIKYIQVYCKDGEFIARDAEKLKECKHLGILGLRVRISKNFVIIYYKSAKIYIPISNINRITINY